MPTFIVFGALTQVPLSDLDNNFAVLAAIASIPCTAVGTNTLVLTPQAGMPAVPAYSNLMPFSAIAANTNTAAATAQIGALAALNIYRDTASGPQPLTGGEITTNNQFTLVYDPALNSSAGGFHLISAGAYVQATGGTIVGSLAVTGGISGATITINGGDPITSALSTLATLVYTAIPSLAMQGQTVLLAGAQINDVIMLGAQSSPPSVVFQGYVQAAGSVVVRAINSTGASIVPGTVVMRVADLGFAT